MTPKEVGYLCIPLLMLFAIFFPVFSIIDFIYLVSNITVFLLYFGLLIMVFILYGVIFKMYILAYERYIANEKQLRSELQIEIRDEQYKRIYDSVENSRKLRHDIQYHLLTLKGFIDEGNDKKALEYLDNYLENSRKGSVVRYCGNSIVNMLVSHYRDIAEEYKINFSVRIDILDELSVQDTDLSVMLGNMLRNTIKSSGIVAAFLFTGIFQADKLRGLGWSLR